MGVLTTQGDVLEALAELWVTPPNLSAGFVF